MAELKLQVELTFQTYRCLECGRWWAIEYGYSGACPRCSRADISRLERERKHAEACLRAARGAVTRAKNAKAKR